MIRVTSNGILHEFQDLNKLTMAEALTRFRNGMDVILVYSHKHNYEFYVCGDVDTVRLYATMLQGQIKVFNPNTDDRLKWIKDISPIYQYKKQ